MHSREIEESDENLSKIILPNGFSALHGKSKQPPKIDSVTISNPTTSETITITEIREFSFIQLPGTLIKSALVKKNKIGNEI